MVGGINLLPQYLGELTQCRILACARECLLSMEVVSDWLKKSCDRTEAKYSNNCAGLRQIDFYFLKNHVLSLDPHIIQTNLFWSELKILRFY